MSSLVHAALTVRRTARSSYGYLTFVVVAVLDLAGAFRTSDGLGLVHLLVGCAWAAVFARRVMLRSSLEPASNHAVSLDFELGLLLLAAVYAAVQSVGGLTGPLYPLVYVLTAFVASFARKPTGALLVAVAVVFEAGLFFLTERQTDPRPFILHALFIISFGLLHLVFTRAEIVRVRESSRRKLDAERTRAQQDARMFRLVGTATEASSTTDERLYRSSVDEVHNALYHSLDLLRRTLDLHTCVLFFLDEEDPSLLRIVELATDSDDIAEGPFPCGGGAVGAVAHRGLAMNLEHLRPGYTGLCYYRGPALVQAFLGVPVHDQGALRGALCADRLGDRPFTPRDEETLRTAVHQVLRTLENERVFVQLERSKREQSVLYRASQALGSALTRDAVIDGALSAAAEIAAHDFAAITVYEPQSRRHSIVKAVGEGAEHFADLSFRDNTSLTAMAVKTRHYLPYRGEYDPRQQVVFTAKANLRGFESLLIMPLIVREDAIGTLTLAARRRGAFGDGVRTTLQVLANQLAVALANAAAVRRLEELATTDGLTGCLNKRAFLDELSRKLRAAERFGRKLSLIVTDIDHFKSVNDTYGHATGDVVIQELGEVLRRVKRETDVVARFGGEEFCILCEETDADGALLLAERVREQLGGTIFQTEIGKLAVTCSLGVATFPRDAKDEAALFEAADRALYAAKHGGRNRVCTAAGGVIASGR